MTDYRIKITIRNERILSVMEEKGFESVAKFCKAYNLDYVRVAEVIRGKIKPLNQKGVPIKLVEDMLDILDMSLEEAFTDRQLQGFHKTTMQTKVTEKQIKKLINPIRNQEQLLIEKDVKNSISSVLSTLAPRYERVIRLRYGLDGGKEHSIVEISKIFGLSKARVGQMIKKAESQLKHPSRSDEIIKTGFNEIYSKVNISEDRIKQAQLGYDQKEVKKFIVNRNQ
tara:strand:- start:58 stop:735 length:678 start_codon:yes stop_codon:yes gene_type:complete